MPISVAEYLGQRTDIDQPSIYPQSLTPNQTVICQFMGAPCSKIHRSAPQQPICTVRVGDGKPWVVCPHRLIPATSGVVTSSYTAYLAAVAEKLFPDVYPGNIGYKSQVSVNLGKRKKVQLDYVLNASKTQTQGRKHVILEVQGGGETSSTGSITRHAASWALQKPPTNSYLREPIPKTGIIPNNAWKRQLEQILRKVRVAQTFDGGFALVMGEILFDYVKPLFTQTTEYQPDWEIALVCLSETPSNQPGSIRIDSVREVLFMTYSDLVLAISTFPLPPRLNNPFRGTYTTISNHTFEISDEDAPPYINEDAAHISEGLTTNINEED